MVGFTFAQNSRFKWNEHSYRIEQINNDGSLVVYCLHNGHISCIPKQELYDAYAKTELQFLTSESEAINDIHHRPIEEIDELTTTELRRRMAYINGLRKWGARNNTVADVKRVIETIANEINDDNPPSYFSLNRWQNRQLIANGDFRSLIPRTDRRGPHRRYQDTQIIKYFEESLIEVFRKSPKSKVEDVRDKLSEKIKEENIWRPKHLQLILPSRSTCYRLLNEIDRFEVDTLREGKRIASRKYRLVGKGVGTTRITERYEIDHTPLDVFVIDQNTGLPLGRPLITIVLDHYSRMPVGYYVSFSSPSAAVVQAALKHAILPKILTKVPNLSINNEWICWGIPELLAMDNGLEFHGSALEYLAFNLYIQLMFCPKHEPQFKGSIERFIKTLNYQCVHLLPGMSFAKYYERGDYSPDQKAIFTLTELKAILEKWMLDVYAQKIHSGIGVTPYSRWKKGLEVVTPTLPKNVDQLSPIFGIPVIRSLRKDGIVINNIRYSDSGLQAILSKYGPGVRVTATYDPDDLGEIHVFEPDNNEDFVRVSAVNLEYAKGLTSYQNEVIQKHLNEEGKDTTDPEAVMAARIELANFIEDCMLSRKHSVRRKAVRLRGNDVVVQKENTTKGSRRSPALKNSKKNIPIQRPTKINNPPMSTFKFDRSEK